MTLRLRAAILTAFLGFSSVASAQQVNPLDVIPDQMPFNIPYGAPISLFRAQGAIAAVIGAALNRGWALNIAVVDSGANLVAFARMDGAQLGSIAIAEHKARTAVKFRRPTKVFEEGIQNNDYKYQLTLDDVIASRGGDSLDRERQAHRRDRLFRRRRFAGRGGMPVRRSDDQQAAAAIDRRRRRPGHATVG